MSYLRFDTLVVFSSDTPSRFAKLPCAFFAELAPPLMPDLPDERPPLPVVGRVGRAVTRLGCFLERRKRFGRLTAPLASGLDVVVFGLLTLFAGFGVGNFLLALLAFE
ncbi:hypothetical protein [Photobacterium satsumensis]|uniref:hypothetical protein n=1 Tax=Photobacterium satsumensis TaxID=2910239 RepID=UPI003D0EA679